MWPKTNSETKLCVSLTLSGASLIAGVTVTSCCHTVQLADCFTQWWSCSPSDRCL